MVAPVRLFDATRRHRRRQTMKRVTTSPPGFLAVLSVVLLSHFVTPVGSQDTIKVAVGQIDSWANQVPTLGMRAGTFKDTASFWKISALRAPVRRCKL